MKHLWKYNHLLFTEHSRDDRWATNLTFWQMLDTFDRSHPDVDLVIIRDVKRDRHLGRYVEFLEFQCSQEWAYKQVLSIYRQHYHYLALELHPDLSCEPTDEEIHLS